jgi:hypothetical protein
MGKWLKQSIAVPKAQRFPVLVLFLHYFLISAAVIAGKSARDAFFLSEFPKTALPAMYFANAVCVALAMAAFTYVSKKFSPGVATASTLGFFSITVLLIDLVLSHWMMAVLYVWMEVIGAVVVLQAWILTGNAFDPRQAKQFFGVIASGGSIAAWAGGSSVAWIASRYGTESLLLIVAAVLAVSMATATISSRFRALRPDTPKPVRIDTKKRLQWSPYLVSIAVIIACTAIVSALVQYKFQIAAAEAYPTREQMVAFFGQFYAWSGAASLASQLFLSNFILSRFGVIAGLFVLPGSFLLSVFYALFSPSLFSAAAGRFADLSLKFTVNNSSLEVLWLPIPPEERQAVKPTISGTVKAVSEGATAILLFGLVALLPAWGLSAFALCALGVWAVTVVRLRGQYSKALARVVERRQLNPELLRIDIADPEVVRALKARLRSDDEAEQLAALSFLDGYPLEPWTAALNELYGRGSAEIRKRLLALAGDKRTVISDAAILETIRSGGDLAAHAADVAASRDLKEVAPLLRGLLENRDPRKAATAAVALCRNQLDENQTGERSFREWLQGSDEAWLVECLRAASRAPELVSVDAVIRCLRWPKSSVRVAALEAAARLGSPAVLKDVVACLADARCVMQVRTALRSMPPEAVVDALCEVASNMGLSFGARMSALRCLREYSGHLSERRIVDSVYARHLVVYAEFAELLRTIRSKRPLEIEVMWRLPLDKDFVRREAYFWEYVRETLPVNGNATLLRDHACHRFTLATATTLRLSALQAPGFPVEACLHASLSGDRSRLPYVLELLESSLTSEDRKYVAPLLDESQSDNRIAIRKEMSGPSPMTLEVRLIEGSASEDPWESMISRHYLDRTREGGPAAGGDGIRKVDMNESMEQILERTILLKSSDLFGGIAAENLSRLAAVAVELRYPVGCPVFREGDPGDALFLVVSGGVTIEKAGHVIATLSKGGCFGEMAVLDPAPRSADATVAEEAVLLRIGAEDFFDVLAENPILTQGIFALLSRRLREANERLAASGS